MPTARTSTDKFFWQVEARSYSSHYNRTSGEFHKHGQNFRTDETTGPVVLVGMRDGGLSRFFYAPSRPLALGARAVNLFGMVSTFVRRVTIATQLVLSGNFVTRIQNQWRDDNYRVMYQRPLPRPWQYWSQRRINTLAEGLRAQRYLEIGIEHGRTAEKINVRERVGVDPAPRFDTNKLPSGFSFFAVESDTYFGSLASEATFDLAFLDGLHTFEQTKIDLFNTLRHVPSGVVLIDDTVPVDEIAGLPDQDEARALRRETGSKEIVWMGDVWKLVVYIDRYLPQLDFRTIVGSGNVQTLVWRRIFGETISEPSGNELEELNYRETFASGIPDQFRPCNEVDAIQACLTAVQLHR